ncbi:type I glyceraldehyde-3-phosphate dehydrogenase [Pseudahrensia aquimaris]|uniref:Glyceraldehyde-3-phosphate dehydrogenase n=1 Tax=Pseudahrensia aquimaris TaxID=744461 RepID=A0ABW3FAH1_9HYPH
MAIRVAINGFGRIGRLTYRAIHELGCDDIEVVAINNSGPVETHAHLLRYDSVHGNFPDKVKVEDNTINIGRGPVPFYADRNPANLPWGELGVDIVLECTGAFNSTEKAMPHITQAGAKRVLLSAPGKPADKTIVYGVNHNDITRDDLVISAASCTTNCLAPVVFALNNAIGIDHGFMTTVHSYTGDQPTLDRHHKDVYRARAAAVSMIPTSTGAAKAVGLVIPELQGKLDGSAVRVPTPNVSLVDLKFVASRKTTVEEINEAMRVAASSEPLQGILDYDPEPKVSVDFNHNPASSCFAPAQTRVMSDTMVQIMAWYDNEWGFSCRMTDVTRVMGGLL